MQQDKEKTRQLRWAETPPENIERAKELRQRATMAERKLWSRLRNCGLKVKFRRQQPIGEYIVDFFSADCALVVEVDGDSHGSDEARDYDERRTAYLQSKGLRVVRYTNRDVMKNFDSVLNDLVQKIEER